MLECYASALLCFLQRISMSERRKEMEKVIKLFVNRISITIHLIFVRLRVLFYTAHLFRFEKNGQSHRSYRGMHTQKKTENERGRKTKNHNTQKPEKVTFFCPLVALADE